MKELFFSSFILLYYLFSYPTSHNMYYNEHRNSQCIEFENTSLLNYQEKNTQDAIRKNAPTMENLFARTLKSFLNQYGTFMSLLHSLDNNLIMKIIYSANQKLFSTLKVNNITENKYIRYYKYFFEKMAFNDYNLLALAT